MANDKEYVEDHSLDELAEKVITQERLTHLLGVSIKYLFVVPEISRTIHARVIRGTAELRHFGQFDYLVEFSHKIWQVINNDTRYALMLHLMMHIIVSQDEKTGITSYKIAKHDLSDFNVVLQKYGINWFSEFKDAVAMTYEMKAKEKDQISI